MLTFQVEAYADVVEEAKPLLVRHNAEIAPHPDLPFSPRWGDYETLAAHGLLRIYTARIDGELVGYSVFAIAPALHCGAAIEATEHTLFVAPEHRKGRVGIGLIKFGDEQLGSLGVDVVMRCVHVDHDFGPLLVGHMGYSPVYKIYGRRLSVSKGQ
jgi:GNAT superfamily N-acetyltransferase